MKLKPVKDNVGIPEMYREFQLQLYYSKYDRSKFDPSKLFDPSNPWYGYKDEAEELVYRIITGQHVRKAPHEG